MKWLNEPAKWESTNNSLNATSDGETDFWRKTHDDGIRHNGHFYYDSIAGDFTAQVKISGKYHSLYDQAGLMMLLDEKTWIKCGIEYVEGQQYVSAVVTRDDSDWSILPVPNPSSIWLRCSRHIRTFTISYSLDGEEFHMIRQCSLTIEPFLDIGMMLASPKGNGFEVNFEEFSVVKQ